MNIGVDPKISIKVLFFTHPGGEHSFNSKKSGIKDWNTKNHARKFMTVNGEYIDRLPISQEDVPKISKGKISFWGEWEQPSKFETNTVTEPGLPKRLHEPLIIESPVLEMLNKGEDYLSEQFNTACTEFYKGKQNTDPYVFGNRFMYCCCKQNRKKKGGSTSDMAAKKLTRGDIIVFYSYTGSKADSDYICHLDTVFVVGGVIAKGKYIDIWPELLRTKKITTNYLTATILPVCFGNQDEVVGADFTLYYGATYSDPVIIYGQPIFSFFPCKIATECPNGYPRYQHEPFDVYKNGSKTGEKIFSTQNPSQNEYSSKDLLDFWNDLTHDILDQGYLLGIKAEEPDVTSNI